MTDRGPAEAPSTGFLSPSLRLFARHQVGAFVGTCADFGVMILCVEAFGVLPTAAAAAGAIVGALTNFTLGRVWIFRRRSGDASSQILRYAVVSVTSATLNSCGEYLVHDVAHVRYVLARVLVAFAIGVLWNFPMQRHFVFR